MAAQSSITLYFDVVSPYSYLGFVLLQRYRKVWTNVKVDFKPLFLHGVMTGSKNQPPATVAAKGTYMFTDLMRISAISKIPVKFPSRFPISTILPQRLLLAIQKYEPAKLEEAILKFYEAYWALDKDVSDKQVLVDALLSVFGGSMAKVEQMFAATQEAEIKKLLTDNTNECVQKGGFGAPFFSVTKAGSDKEHLIFGSDRFEIIANLLGVPYPGLAFSDAAKL
ncbi:Glutathione S-transferase kappa 1 [Actinomortierella ambigua]|nr:Glutathione S-transferase kappa 1 [Actinomortierella ambigua]